MTSPINTETIGSTTLHVRITVVLRGTRHHASLLKREGQ
jgi:hypothetical protein